MLKRFLTSIVIMALTIGFFALRYVSPFIFDAFLGVIVLCSTYEVAMAFEKHGKLNDKYFVLAYPVALYGALLWMVLANNDALANDKRAISLITYFGIVVGLMILIFAITLIINLLSKTKINKEIANAKLDITTNKYALRKSMLNLFLMMYPAFILSIFFLINHLSSFAFYEKIVGKNIEVFLLIMIFATTIITDTFAYIIGGGIGGKKLCPKISPNKTISGAIGGLVCSIAFSLLLYVVFATIGGYADTFTALKLNIFHFIGYGTIASIFSQCGDIFASLIKRINGLKDYGHIFPGHGGFMDRVDGLAFNGLVTFILSLFVFM